MKYCPNCIAQLPDDATVCDACGEPQRFNPEEKKGHFVDMSGHKPSNFYKTPEYIPPTPVKVKKQISIIKPLIALILILAIAATVFGVLFMTRGSSTPEKAAVNVMDAIFTDKDADDVYKYSISRSMQSYYKKECKTTKKDIIEGYDLILDVLKSDTLSGLTCTFKVVASKKISKDDEALKQSKFDVTDVSDKLYLVTLEATASYKGASNRKNIDVIAYKSNFRWFAIPASTSQIYQ